MQKIKDKFKDKLHPGVDTSTLPDDKRPVLAVTVHSAEGLIPRDLDGRPDPYVVISLGRKSKETDFKSNTTTPEFDETVYLDILRTISGKPDHDVEVEVWDKNDILRDTKMGFFEIPASKVPLLNGDPVRETFTIKPPPLAPKGSTGEMSVSLRTIASSQREAEEAETSAKAATAAVETLNLVELKLLEWGWTASIAVRVMLGIFDLTLKVSGIEKSSDVVGGTYVRAGGKTVKVESKTSVEDAAVGVEQELTGDQEDGDEGTGDGIVEIESIQVEEKDDGEVTKAVSDALESSQLKEFQDRSFLEKITLNNLNKLKKQIDTIKVKFHEKGLTGTVIATVNFSILGGIIGDGVGIKITLQVSVGAKETEMVFLQDH